MISAGGAQLNELSERDTGGHCFRRDFVDFAETLVPNQQPMVGIKHAEAMRHVGKRGVEPEILLCQRTSKRDLFPSRVQQAQPVCTQVSRQFDSGKVIEENEPRQCRVDQPAANRTSQGDGL